MLTKSQPAKGDLHCREWAEIVGELHRWGLFWIVADIVAELVLAGRVAVEAHNAICNQLGPEYVRLQLTTFPELLECHKHVPGGLPAALAGLHTVALHKLVAPSMLPQCILHLQCWNGCSIMVSQLRPG